MEEAILTIHILSAAAWIGVAMFFGYAGPRFRDIGGPAVSGWVQVALGAIPRFISPAAVLTLLTGLTLVMVKEEWGFDSGFVWIGIAVFVVVLALGLGWNAPNLRTALAAIEEGDMPTVAASMKKVANAGLAIIVLLVFAEFAMVYRLGG